MAKDLKKTLTILFKWAVKQQIRLNVNKCKEMHSVKYIYKKI